MADKPAGNDSTEKQPPRVRWDTSDLKSSYANVCNVTSTREEVVLNFGVNQAWEQGNAEMVIELSNRLILSPFAAKRLSVMLSNLVDEFEKRHGALDIESPKARAASPQGESDQG